MAELKELLEYIVKELVDSPDQVSVKEIPGEKTVIFELRVGAGDLGKVIGREGRTAKAIRQIIQAAAMRKGKRAHIEILE
ncbi:MAG: KH domain-containing protein [bacterium]|nr:KH domain-containing protein [bacterium]